MPFPMTHLRVAEQMLSLRAMNDDETAAFLLGSIAPDAVHYRPGFTGADKKITHLCPISGERWGQVTDNDAWLLLIDDFWREHGPDDLFAAGYCTHILTDIYNNFAVWTPFRTAFPEVAAQGYGSPYHAEWGRIDRRLRLTLPENNPIDRLLPQTDAFDFCGLVTAEEINAIRDNVLHVSYTTDVCRADSDISNSWFITYERVARMVTEAAVYAAERLFT